MDPKHRELLASNCEQLEASLDLNDAFVCMLLLRKVFTLPMLEDILCEQDEKAKKEKLILELQTRGPFAFQKFLAILHDAGQTEAAAVLEGKQSRPIKREQEYRKHSGNEGPLQLVVRKAKAPKSGPTIFKMTTKPRGKCLIINNIDFGNTMKYRYGSQKDGMRLDLVFNQLGYDVKLKTDLGAEEMELLLEKFAKDPEHEQMDSCIVTILSHGNSGLIYGVDGEKLNTEYIISFFNNENCPALRGKPKIFFIQACRGRNCDSGVERIESADAGIFPPLRPKSVTRMATYSDMLITYSTIDGYVSIRDHKLGTWFCQELVDALIEDACDTDLETILKRVDAKVQDRVSGAGDKQSTECIRRGWNKTFYFNPGFHDSV